VSLPRIGALRHRIMLEAQVRAADGGGGATVTWTPVAELWAGIEPITGSETVRGEALAGRVSHEVTVRHRPGVEPAMRFRLGSRVFEIKAVLDVDERRRMLRCLCREELL
jgi:SPP1 family predicted phage head-tail adaptor